jgi:hypothetical protein
MELLFVAVVALVVLARVDAPLWPRPAGKTRRPRRTVRPPRRPVARPISRSARLAPRPMLGYAQSATPLRPAPRWWWE